MEPTNTLPIPPLALSDLLTARMTYEEALKDFNALARLTQLMLGLDPNLPHQVDFQKGIIIPFVPGTPTLIQDDLEKVVQSTKEATL